MTEFCVRCAGMYGYVCTSYSVGTEGYFPRQQSGRGVKLTIHFHLVLGLRMCGGVLPLSHTSS